MSSYDCPATPPELPLNSATPPPAQPKIDATNEGNGGVGQSQAPPSAPARPSSPESCAICLGELANKSVTDSCLHGFCFTCLLEWSKVKPECPLCKAKFGSIIHTIKNDEKYERYEIPPRPPPGPDVLTNEDYIDYRSRIRAANIDRIRRIEAAHPNVDYVLPAGPPERRRPQAMSTSGGGSAGWRRRRGVATSEFRLSVYRRKMYVNPESVTDITGRYRETSPEWYRNNQATTHRLVPWLNRELNVLLETAPYQSAMAIQLILDTIQRHEIRSQEFTEQLLPYLGTRTEHFQHEFFNYARSYYDMVGFDRHAEYVNRPDPPPQPADRPHALPTLQHLNDQRPANETQVISSESSDTDGADDIVVVDEVQADPASRLDDLTARVRRRLARYGRLPLPPGMSIPPILGAPQASTSSSSAVGGATAVPNPTDDPQPSTSSGAASGNQQRIIIPSDSSDSDSSTLRGEDDEDAVEIVDVLPPKKDRHHEVVDLSSSDEAATGTGTAEKEEPKAGSSGASASSAAAAAAASIYDGVPILISSSEEEDEAMAGCSSNITVSPFSLSKKRSALEEQIERVKNSLKSSTANAKQAWSSSDSEDDQDQARDSLVAAVRSTWSSAAEDFENGTAAADDENVPKPKGKGKGKRSRRPENERDRVNPQSTTTANSSSTSTPMATDMRLSGASTEAALTSPVIPSRSDLGHGAQDDSSKSGASRKKRRRKRVRKKLDPKWFSSSSSSSNEDVDNTSSSRGTSAEASRATSALPPGSRSETSEEQPESDDHLPLAMRFGVGKKMSLLELERRLRKRILERTQGNSSSTSGGDQVESGGDRSQLRQEGQDGRRRSDDRSSDEEDESLSERPSKRGKKDARY